MIVCVYNGLLNIKIKWTDGSSNGILVKEARLNHAIWFQWHGILEYLSKPIEIEIN